MAIRNQTQNTSFYSSHGFYASFFTLIWVGIEFMFCDVNVCRLFFFHFALFLFPHSIVCMCIFGFLFTIR